MENVEEGKPNVLALASESRIEDMFKEIEHVQGDRS